MANDPEDVGYGKPVPEPENPETEPAEPSSEATAELTTPEDDGQAEREAESARRAEAAKIRQFEKQIEVPDFLQEDFKRFDEDRKYVSHDCMIDADDEDTVSTNFILRNQFVLISQIYAKDPRVAVQPKQMIGPYPPGLFEFAQTCELLSQRLVTESGLKDLVTGCLQDVQTCGIAWVKISTQTDLTLDPIGARRHDDQLDNQARLGSLLQRYAEGAFDDDSAEYADMVNLSDTIRQYMKASIQEDIEQNPPEMQIVVNPDGSMAQRPNPADPRLSQLADMETGGVPLPTAMVPEVPHFIGFNLDPVMPEDLRWDWSIIRPEDFYSAKWVAHRVYMAPDEIMDKWQVKREDLARAAPTGEGPKKSVIGQQLSDNPADRAEVEATKLNDRYAVWEMWDKATGRIYTWVQGMDRFLTNIVPTYTWRKWFPFLPLVFNRLTGKFIPISDVRLQMPLQDEINTKRTHEREAQKACYPRYLASQGLLSPAEKAKIENALPYKVVEVRKADEVSKGIYELKVAEFKPELYDISKPVREIEIMAGIPQQAAGGVGNAEFATEAAIANQQMGVQSDRRRNIVEDFLRDIYECVIEHAIQILPEANVKQLVGPGAVMPILQREHMWRMLDLEIKAGSSGKPDKQKNLEMWTQFADIAQRLGVMVNGPEVFKRILDEMEMPVDLARFTIDPMMAQMMAMNGMLPPGVQPVGPSAGQPPGQPGQPPGGGGNIGPGSGVRTPPGMGPAGPFNPAAGKPGAPPMSQRGVPSPGGVPNRPSAATA